MKSKTGFELHHNQTLYIPVEDATFAGNCGAGSVLTQDDAYFITQRVFASDFTGLRYDAANCATAPIDDREGP